MQKVKVCAGVTCPALYSPHCIIKLRRSEYKGQGSHICTCLELKTYYSWNDYPPPIKPIENGHKRVLYNMTIQVGWQLQSAENHSEHNIVLFAHACKVGHIYQTAGTRPLSRPHAIRDWNPFMQVLLFIYAGLAIYFEHNRQTGSRFAYKLPTRQ